MRKRTLAAILVGLSSLSFVTPALASGLSRGAAKRAAARNARALGEKLAQDPSNGTLIHAGVNGCTRESAKMFLCQTEVDLAQYDGGVIGCTQDVSVFTLGPNPRILVQYIDNSTNCAYK